MMNRCWTVWDRMDSDKEGVKKGINIICDTTKLWSYLLVCNPSRVEIIVLWLMIYETHITLLKLIKSLVIYFYPFSLGFCSC
jgi:hypothetical protein